MNDLISRAASLNAIFGCFNVMEYKGIDMTVARTIVKGTLDGVPAVDAAPVVRCRDCKYGKLCFDADGHGLLKCTNTKYPAANVETWPLELDWYCAGGERRES